MRLILFQLVRSFTGSMIVDPSYGSPIFPSAVETLLMGGNQIRSLPSRVTDKQGIKVTSRGGNQKRSLPSRVTDKPGIKVTSMGGNQIRSLPSRVTDKPGIKVTSMGGANPNKQTESRRYSINLIDIAPLPPTR